MSKELRKLDLWWKFESKNNPSVCRKEMNLKEVQGQNNYPGLENISVLSFFHFYVSIKNQISDL